RVVAPGDRPGLGAVGVEGEGQRERPALADRGGAAEHGGLVDQVEGAPLVVGTPPTGVRDTGGERGEVLREPGHRSAQPAGAGRTPPAGDWAITGVGPGSMPARSASSR